VYTKKEGDGATDGPTDPEGPTELLAEPEPGAIGPADADAVDEGAEDGRTVGDGPGDPQAASASERAAREMTARTTARAGMAGSVTRHRETR
jgi:hypothetical protein